MIKLRIVLGITGASGSIYAYTLIRLLHSQGISVDVILTDMGEKVIQYECDITKKEIEKYANIYDNHDLFADIASGSCLNDGMVIVPCSMNSLGSLANGLGDTLITRCASVMLKEKRPLVALIRETPLNILQIKNMLSLAEAGAIVMPATPSFYNHPKEIWELVRSIDLRIMDVLGIHTNIGKRWNGYDK